MIAKTKDVLVVDDDEGIRNVVATALRRLGLACDTATDGADALDWVGSTRYSVMLVDLTMPRVDGEMFAAAVAAHEWVSHEHPVLLVMTAMPVRSRLVALGTAVHAVVQKPFDVIELAELVRSCVDARRELAPPAAETARAIEPESRHPEQRPPSVR